MTNFSLLRQAYASSLTFNRVAHFRFKIRCIDCWFNNPRGWLYLHICYHVDWWRMKILENPRRFTFKCWTVWLWLCHWKRSTITRRNSFRIGKALEIWAKLIPHSTESFDWKSHRWSVTIFQLFPLCSVKSENPLFSSDEQTKFQIFFLFFSSTRRGKKPTSHWLRNLLRYSFARSNSRSSF